MSTNAPRTILNLKEEATSDELALDSNLAGDSSSAQEAAFSQLLNRRSATDKSRVYKQCLLELERLSALWLDVEELDARLTNSFPNSHSMPPDSEDISTGHPLA